MASADGSVPPADEEERRMWEDMQLGLQERKRLLNMQLDHISSLRAAKTKQLQRRQQLDAQRQTLIHAEMGITRVDAPAAGAPLALPDVPMLASVEDRYMEAKAELEDAREELSGMTAALEKARSVLGDKDEQLEAAKHKLTTLMAMTRDLVQMAKPIAALRKQVGAATDGLELADR